MAEVTIEDVRRLRLEPGDFLVVTLDARSAEEFAYMGEWIREVLPAELLERVVVTSREVEFSVISEASPQ